MASFEGYFQAPAAGLNPMAHSGVRSKLHLLEFQFGARTRLRSYLVLSGRFGSQAPESPPVELRCSLITPLPGSAGSLC
jgi:hypothetical protein